MTENTEDTADTQKEEKKRHEWDDTIRTLIYAILLALVFRSLAYEPFHIPSSSMKDTLLIGDYIFVSKYSYGYSRYSFPYGSIVPYTNGRVIESVPERGDVVVFRLPAAPHIDFIKRVIGLPGDQIQMRSGVLYINGNPVRKEADGEFVETQPDGTVLTIRRYKETLPEGKQYNVLDMTQLGEVDNTGIYTVPEGHYFMMGDNRDNSTDSRYIDQVGFVPAANLIGKAQMIFFSMEDGTAFWEFWKWPEALRAGRFFKSIK